MSIEKSSDLIGNRTCNLPACNMVPQPTMLPITKPIPKCTKFNPEDRAACSFETSTPAHKTAWYHNPEDCNLSNDYYENFTTYIN
jgi:hypothetical protein